jgi:hypothetical protein
MLSVVGLVDRSSFSFSGLPSGYSVPSVSGKIGFGLGALIDVPIREKISLEFGALYITRSLEVDSTSTSQGGDDVTYTFHAIELPLLLKARIFRRMTFGLGGYLAKSIGDVNYQDATVPSKSNSGESYSDLAIKPADIGLLASLGVLFPLRNGMHFFSNVRYAYGISNANSGGNGNYYFRDLQFLAGLSFPLGAQGREF